MDLIKYVGGIYDLLKEHSVPSDSLVRKRREKLANKVVSRKVDSDCFDEPSGSDKESAKSYLRRGSYISEEDILAKHENLGIISFS